jgi:hypothetical protein
MDECCCPPPQAARRQPCPACGVSAAVVEPQTVKAVLMDAALRRFEVDAYYFCASFDCDVVYFGLGGGRLSKRDLRVPVWQKEPPGSRTLCYCFGENEADIRAELQQTRRPEAVSRVREHIAARRCACDIRNPSGACCLGDLISAVKRIEELLRSEVLS